MHSGAVYPLATSDHNLIFGIRKLAFLEVVPNMLRLEILRSLMRVHFYQTKNSRWLQFDFNSVNVNEACKIWKGNIVLDILNKHASKRVIKVRNKPAPWLNSEMKILRKSSTQ